MLSIEPAPRYGRTDRYWPVTVEAIGRVAPDGWEKAKEWWTQGDPVHARCVACRAMQQMTPRVKSSDAIVVLTCNRCGTAHPDAIATKAAIRGKIEDWIRTGKATVKHGADGKPIGIKLPSHEDVMEDAEVRKMLQDEQDSRGTS